jgi:diguanylate cyclase (GGDEF)-like protein
MRAVRVKAAAYSPPPHVSAVGGPSPTAVTAQEMPAVRVKAVAYSLPPNVSAVGGPSPTAITAQEMPAVRPDAERSSVSSLPPYEDNDAITDVTEMSRHTDVGAPPSLPAERDRSLLVRMDGVSAGQVESVGRTELSIGRHPSNALTIQDGGISRQHARILSVDNKHVIEDLGSRNGTYVQGSRITRAELNDGDWIQLGPRASFRYSVTDAKQEVLMRQLYESSTRDALTGAHNRQHFEERLRTEVAYAVRHSTNVSLVLFDLDYFKRVNDNYGHLAGDAVLRSVAATVGARLRAEDVFARYGGEEFAVVLRGIDATGAQRVAERLRSSIADTVVNYKGLSLQITISAGSAALSECSRPTGIELVGLADRRLYVAKDGGRNRVVAEIEPLA